MEKSIILMIGCLQRFQHLLQSVQCSTTVGHSHAVRTRHRGCNRSYDSWDGGDLHSVTLSFAATQLLTQLQTQNVSQPTSQLRRATLPDRTDDHNRSSCSLYFLPFESLNQNIFSTKPNEYNDHVTPKQQFSLLSHQWMVKGSSLNNGDWHEDGLMERPASR